MNAPDRHLDWSEANQRLLVAEFARIEARLAGRDDEAARAVADTLRATLAQPAAIDQLADSFGLSAFERDVVLLCAGVEMEARLATLCGEASGHPQRIWASFGLATSVLANPHWSAISPMRPLRRWKLVEVEGGVGLTSARLTIDERVLHFLAGVDYLDPRLEPLLRGVAPPGLIAPSHADLCQAIVARLSGERPPLPAVVLHGPDGDAREDIAASCAEHFGLRLQAIDSGALSGGHGDVVALTVLCEREAALGASALLVDCRHEAPTAQALQLVERMRGIVFLGASRAPALRRASIQWEVAFPGRAEQRLLWEQALGAAAPEHEHALAAVATQFRLSARSIDEKAGLAAAGPTPSLWQICRRSESAGLAELAQRIEASADWDDLVLPDAQKQTLAQIAVHMRHRIAVYDDWGFAAKGNRGLGISALFAGESGTGKTMAAEVLARELDVDLFRIDLSSVVSKYIGETEKNLRQVFDVAEGTGAMLLFDEADALFGKRSEVKDSHDRYANIEVSYLLQRMEAFRGLAILTTNHKAALDTAFMRRLRFIVHFPFPETAEREQIWRRAFPAAVQTGGIAFDKLARLQMSGGHIHNIALAAAFLAVDAGQEIGMPHLLRAARAESAKRERPLADAEIRGWT